MKYLLLCFLPFAIFANPAQVMIEARFIEDDEAFTEKALVVGPEVVKSYLKGLDEGADILSAPKITVLSGQEGRIEIVDEQQQGVTLTVTATVSDDRKSVTLDAHPKVVEGNMTREVHSMVILPDTHSIVLGGMQSEHVVQVDDRVPVLSAIPILGRLFRSEHEHRAARYLTVVLTATVVE